MSSQLLNQISFSKESVWGTQVTPAKSVEVKFSGGLNTKTNPKYVEGVKALIAKEHDAVLGSAQHEGEFELDLLSDYPAYFFLSALGSVSSALHSGETLVSDHTLTENVTHPSLSIEQAYGEEVSRFLGSIASGFKLSIKTGEIPTVQFPMMAKSRVTGATKISPAYSATEKVFDFSDFVIKVGGSQLTEILSVDFEYKNNVQFLPALNNSADPAFNYVKSSEVTCKIQAFLDSTSLTSFNDYIAKTERSLELIGTKTAVIGSAAHNAIDILCPRGIWTASDEKLSDGYNLLDLSFTGMYDTVTSKLISVVITNLLSALS